MKTDEQVDFKSDLFGNYLSQIGGSSEDVLHEDIFLAGHASGKKSGRQEAIDEMAGKDQEIERLKALLSKRISFGNSRSGMQIIAKDWCVSQPEESHHWFHGDKGREARPSCVDAFVCGSTHGEFLAIQENSQIITHLETRIEKLRRALWMYGGAATWDADKKHNRSIASEALAADDKAKELSK